MKNEDPTPFSHFSFLTRRDVLVCLFLIIATLAVYLQVRNFAFVNYDDPKYISGNPNVQAGLTLENITWAFTATYQATWQPLVWLSYMLGCQLHGMDPGWHHLTNVFLHIASTILLFLVFRRMTGELWRSGFVAALFALHPLHVESVAWVTERKDVLSTFFWMLTMWSYVRYVEHPEVKRYLPALLFFILGLMTKPMLVTLPFVLLLLDCWPLSRFQPGESGRQQFSHALRLFLEKIPFFILAAASSVLTFLVQQKGGAVAPLTASPLDLRVANALVSYVAYIGKMIWPFHLAVMYPYPDMLPWWKVAGACLLLVGISLMAISVLKRRPYVAVGWLWYMGTLLPVIGLVQIGRHAMADRFTYVPLVGMFIIVAWGVPELVARLRYRETGLAIIATALLSTLTAATWLQVRYWANSITLFEHTIDVTANNSVAHNCLGCALAEQGRTNEAISHFSEALRIYPDDAKAHNNLGNALLNQGRRADAIRHYSEALRIEPDYADAHINLGIAFSGQGRFDEAVSHFSEALRIRADVQTHFLLGIVLDKQGRTAEAIKHFSEALRIKPDFAAARDNLKKALAVQRKIQKNN